MPVWRNWQTHGTQNPAVAIPCRFDPDYRHQAESSPFCGLLFRVIGNGGTPKIRSRLKMRKKHMTVCLHTVFPFESGDVE